MLQLLRRLLLLLLSQWLTVAMLSLVGLRNAQGFLPHAVIIMLLLPEIRRPIRYCLGVKLLCCDGGVASRYAQLQLGDDGRPLEFVGLEGRWALAET